MKKDDKASISLQKVISVGIILIFLMGITVFAVNSKVTNVKIILSNGYEITVRAGLHCSPLIHEAMGTKNSGTVRVSVSWFTKEEEILAFLEAAGQIAVSLRGAD